MLLIVVVCLLNAVIYGREFFNAATCGRVFVEYCYLSFVLNVATCHLVLVESSYVSYAVECCYLWSCVC
jgi:hypothetical protein